jgi:hypothetical protein
MIEQLARFCFYCEKLLHHRSDVVEGAHVAAHRACVHARLDRINPKWRKEVTGNLSADSALSRKPADPGR